MVSSLDVLTTREGKWDRTASVLGFWVSRGIALISSSGTQTDRARAYASGLNDEPAPITLHFGEFV